MTGVVEGRDGWFFLAGGTNNADRLYKDADCLPPDWAPRWSALLRSRQLLAHQHGARYLHLIAPEKTSIYPEHFPDPLPFFGRHPCGYLGGLQRPELIDSLIDPSLAFLQEKYLRDVYLRTDSHWNVFAAEIVTNLAMQRLGFEQRIDVRTLSLAAQTVVGDLASKLPERRSEMRPTVQISPSIIRTHHNETVSYNEKHHGIRPAIHVGAAVTLVNSAPTAIDKCLLIFGDSYASYAAGGLTHMFAELFREVHFVWSQNIDVTLFRKLSPDVLVTEGAERFMTRVPEDRLDLTSFVQTRVEQENACYA